MSRATLRSRGGRRGAAGLAAAVLVAAGAAAQGGRLPSHLDPSVVLVGCSGCHQGHGAPGSPMLPGPQADVCLACHDSQFRLDDQVARGILAPGIRPPLLGSVLKKPFTHPLDPQAFSSMNGVTCTSCHTPHRSPILGGEGLETLPLDRSEAEVCGACHGGPGLLGFSTYTSYHPVGMPAAGRSPSLDPALAGSVMRCTDCHYNDDPAGPRGPHGSNQPFILGMEYTTGDGIASPNYNLCFQCHREDVLLRAERDEFSLHVEHVVVQRTACATCHSPHGSFQNPALIRIGEGSLFSIVSPSASGALLFESQGPGQGKCYLTCHGSNHDPKTYGIDVTLGDPPIKPPPVP